MFVRWAPRPHIAASLDELPVGSVGVVTDPAQHDLSVYWVGYEDAEPTRGWVFSVEDREIITARDFALAVLENAD